MRGGSLAHIKPGLNLSLRQGCLLGHNTQGQHQETKLGLYRLCSIYTYETSKFNLSLSSCFVRTSISPRANCSLLLSLTSLALVSSCCCLSSCRFNICLQFINIISIHKSSIEGVLHTWSSL